MINSGTAFSFGSRSIHTYILTYILTYKCAKKVIFRQDYSYKKEKLMCNKTTAWNYPRLRIGVVEVFREYFCAA